MNTELKMMAHLQQQPLLPVKSEKPDIKFNNRNNRVQNSIKLMANLGIRGWINSGIRCPSHTI
jgi:hypothetical protein